MATVTTLRDRKITHDIMEPHLSGDSLSYHPETVTTYAYRCDGCGNIWAKKWYATECEKRGHVPSFDQVYTYRPEGFQTHGRYERTVYTRRRIGRDNRIAERVN